MTSYKRDAKRKRLMERRPWVQETRARNRRREKRRLREIERGVYLECCAVGG